jgi:hypothetical protein
MRLRGVIYWNWSNPNLPVLSHDQRFPDGTLINVQVRTSVMGYTQLFVGAYGQKGAMIFEESFDSRPLETMTQAMAWGLSRAIERVTRNADAQPLLTSFRALD